MNPTKNALAPLIHQIAIEEKLIANCLEARELEQKLRNFEASSFEQVLRARAKSLREKATSNSSTPFSSEFYSGQADTIDSLIRDLPRILS